MANLAIIPARGGSKRIPGKNSKKFLGKPIIGYSIEAALESKLFDEVMVSTDDNEIAEIAQNFGAKIPFLRSPKNAGDFAVLAEVILEVIEMYKKQNISFEKICCLLPTAPFVTPNALVKSLKFLVEGNFDTVFPILEFSYPIQRSLKIIKNKVEMVWPEFLNSRSQDLESRFHDAGQFYWLNQHTFLKEKRLFGENSGGFVISQLNAQDIDTPVDWKLAEIKYELMLDNDEDSL